jgi:hypothetical protein
MRTDENLKLLSDELQKNCGDIHAACRAVGVSPHFLMNWMKDDAEACAVLEEAQKIGWMGLESVAIQRATVGVEEDVYFKGEVVGQKTVTSDSLLVKVMEARIPAYQKKTESGHATFNGPTQINMMPRAETFDEWLAMKDQTLARRALAAPVPSVQVPEIIQGDFIEVVNPMASLKDLI